MITGLAILYGMGLGYFLTTFQTTFERMAWKDLVWVQDGKFKYEVKIKWLWWFSLGLIILWPISTIALPLLLWLTHKGEKK